MPLPFSLPVVGAPYPNKDGSDRAFEILLCARGESVELRPEPKNPYDEHAIAVFSARGVQIGYVTSERAPYVHGLLRAGHALFAVFQEATPWGAAVRIGIDSPPVLPPPSTFQGKPPAYEDGVDPDPGFWPDDPPPDY